MQYPRIKSINIKGYRTFKDFTATLSDLEVIVGANGAGKTCLFEFLKLLRNGMTKAISPEILAGSLGENVFHVGGEEKIQWQLEIDLDETTSLRYLGEIVGPVHSPEIAWERVETVKPFNVKQQPYLFLDVKNNRGEIQELNYNNKDRKFSDSITTLPKELALSKISNPAMVNLYKLREYISGWRFYSSFNIAREKIRKPVLIKPEPILDDDCGNLSSVLHYFLTEHPATFDELRSHAYLGISNFKNYRIKARGNPGEVMTFVEEKNLDAELKIGYLSDGSLRIICWFCVALHPKPPSLICIDGVEDCIHPKNLDVLAAFLEDAAEKTQVFVTTHASHLLQCFDVSKTAVIRKKYGKIQFIKPGQSAVILAILEDFGQDHVGHMHWSEELEFLPCM